MAQRARRVEEEGTARNETGAGDKLAELIRQVEDNPAIILTDRSKFEAYFAHVEGEALAAPVDLSSKAGRDKIAAAAYGVARRKTAIDNAGKQLTEDWRRKTKIVNEVRNEVKERFDALRDQVRQPLTDWEAAEDARKAEADRIIDLLQGAATVLANETSADVQARLDHVRGINLNDEVLGARIDMATDLRDEAVKALTEAAARLQEQERERAELAQLRREKEEREAREQAERAEASRRQEEERRRVAAEERVARERAEAADRARREAEEAADRARQEELERIEREKQAAIDAANERARKAEAEASAERERIAQAQAAREAEERRQEEERTRREADRSHRTKVMTAAKQAIMTCGVPEETAKTVVLAIKAGEVPHVSMAF